MVWLASLAPAWPYFDGEHGASNLASRPIMPIRSTLKNGIVYTEITGEISYEITCQQIDYIVSLKSKIKNHYEFSDLTKVVGVDLTGDDMEKIAHYLEKSKGLYPHTYVAYFVANDFQYGMARMFETHMELADHPMKIGVFSEKEEALQFLNNAKKTYG